MEQDFGDCCDVEIAEKYVYNAQHILEMGAKEGRVVEYLVRAFPDKKISAVESNSTRCAQIEKTCGGRLTLYHEDLFNFVAPQKYDLILWMWSNIGEFEQSAYRKTLGKLSSWLMPGGRVILDLLLEKPPTIQSTTSADTPMPVGVFSNYLSDMRDIYEYAREVELPVLEEIPYNTLNGKHRVVFVLKSPSCQGDITVFDEGTFDR